MKTIALIAEYNPLHNGHLQQIEYIKKHFSTQKEEVKIILIMSGNFVQRGEVSSLDKYTKAKLAVEHGISLVIELPVVFATAAARDYARANINLISKLNVVSEIVCGVENPELKETFKLISQELEPESKRFKEALEHNLNQGLNYASAREKSLISIFPEEAANIKTILGKSNNILALEYLLAIRAENIERERLNKRLLKLYFSPRENDYSATKIRKVLLSEKTKTARIKALETSVPSKVLASLINKDFREYKNLYLSSINTVLSSSKEELLQYRDLDEDLVNRLKNKSIEFLSQKDQNLSNYFAFLSTKYYPITRIKRSILAKLLGIKSKDYELMKKDGPSFINLLAADKDGKYLIKLLRKLSTLPNTVKNSDLREELNNNLATSKIQQKLNLKADMLYKLLCEDFSTSLYKDYLYIL